MVKNKTKRIREKEQKENENIFICIFECLVLSKKVFPSFLMVLIGLKKVDCLGKEEETNMKNTLNERKHEFGMKEKRTLNGKEKNLE